MTRWCKFERRWRSRCNESVCNILEYFVCWFKGLSKRFADVSPYRNIGVLRIAIVGVLILILVVVLVVVLASVLVLVLVLVFVEILGQFRCSFRFRHSNLCFAFLPCLRLWLWRSRFRGVLYSFVSKSATSLWCHCCSSAINQKNETNKVEVESQDVFQTPLP